MSDIKITFSKYATLFYKHIDGCKTPKALFVKDILKMGLSEEDRNYIDENFPTQINCKGKSSIEKNKADRLRKYLRGENGISEIVDELVSDFDLEFQERYSEELQDYEDEKIIEFAKKLKLNIDKYDIETVTRDIATFYSTIMKSHRKHTINNNKSKEEYISLSYRLSDDEKKSIKNICSLIEKSLDEAKRYMEEIEAKQDELKKVAASEGGQRLKVYLESCIKSAEEKLCAKSNELEKYCNDAVLMLELKKHLLSSLNDIFEIISKISEQISENVKLEYAQLTYYIYKYRNEYKKLLREIDKV